MIVIGYLIIALFGMDGVIRNAELMIKIVLEVCAGKMYAPIVQLKHLDAVLIYKEEFKELL